MGDSRGDRSTRDIDLLDGNFYVEDPYSAYAWMREHAPAYWDAVNELWGISRYDDIVHIEKRKDVFINSDQDKGGYRPNLPADPAIIGLDDPLHQQRRNLVARRFTPGRWRAGRTTSARWSRHLLDDAMGHGGPIEIVDEVAAPLPAEMIGLLLGFPDEMRPKLQEWSERTICLGGAARATWTTTASSRPWSSPRRRRSSTRRSSAARPTTS
jgi:cytochrome P450 family 142 subfamily A polypeptide 1